MTFRTIILSLALTSFTLPALALDWQSPFLNSDQQGMKLLKEKKYSQAAGKFRHPEWQAYSLYNMGEYAHAAALFSGDNAVSAYNKGLSLAQLGDIDGAIAAYEKALEFDPDFTQAKENKALLEQLKQEQEQEQQGDSGDQEGQGDQDEQQSDPQNSEQQEGSDQQQGDSEQNENDENAAQQDSEADSQNDDNSDEQQDAEAGDVNNSDEDVEEQAAEENSLAQPKDNESLPEEAEQPAAMEEMELSPEELEEQRQLEQWLRGVEDDPGELLRNKFRYQYEQNRRRQQHIDRESEQIW